MPEFLEDPSVLTKDKLKSELVANNVTLPAGEQRKDVYVQLYLQHLTARNRPPLAAGANSKGPPDFSSDEEREPTPVLGSGASVGRGRGAVGRVRRPPHPRVGATETGVWRPRRACSAAGLAPSRGPRCLRRPNREAAGEGAERGEVPRSSRRGFAALMLGLGCARSGVGVDTAFPAVFLKPDRLGPSSRCEVLAFSRFRSEVTSNSVRALPGGQFAT